MAIILLMLLVCCNLNFICASHHHLNIDHGKNTGTRLGGNTKAKHGQNGGTAMDHKAMISVSKRLNKFTLNVQRRISKNSQGNVVISPFSMFTAMSLLQLGAQGNTRKELDLTLKWPHTGKEEDHLNNMRDWYKEISKEANLKMANKAWVSENVQLLKTYQDQINNTFGVEMGLEDFSAPVDAVGNINKWITEKTGGMIKNLLALDAVDSNTALVLANAVYFKGIWKTKFRKKDTGECRFYISSETKRKTRRGKKDIKKDRRRGKQQERKQEGRKDTGKTQGNKETIRQKEVNNRREKRQSRCPFGGNRYRHRNYVMTEFMHAKGSFHTLKRNNRYVDVLEVPYVDDTFSMLFVLPKKNTNVNRAESKIDTAMVSSWIKAIQSKREKLRYGSRRRTNIYIPKFKLQHSLNLNSGIWKIQDAFDAGKADFSKMDETRRLYVSKALHKSVLKIDEEGSEASASTVITLTSRSYTPVRTFIVNRPFLFYLVHNKCGAIVFSGKVMNPKA